MLKIYLQIFGTIAVCVIIFFNYQAFFQSPRKEKMKELRKELRTLVEQGKVLDQVLEHRPQFARLEELQFKDYADVKVFFADQFNEPKFLQRLQKLVDISGCRNNGIIVGRVSKSSKPNRYPEFFTRPKEDLRKSVEAFLKTMNTYTSSGAEWQKIVGPESHYGTRLLFYKSMSDGKKFPTTMNKGLETHRFSLVVKGSYTSCKKFLWLINRNRPFTQATVQSFVPASKGRGPDKMFSCRVIIITYVDKNGEMLHKIEDAQQKTKKG